LNNYDKLLLSTFSNEVEPNTEAKLKDEREKY
jgi:hypothetical protein